jgi:Ribonucleases P/MRP protein subunit POP1
MEVLGFVHPRISSIAKVTDMASRSRSRSSLLRKRTLSFMRRNRRCPSRCKDADTSRKRRRRRGLLHRRYESNGSSSSDKGYMATHLWMVRRFAMRYCWGKTVPLRRYGKGCQRSSSLMNGCVLHDCSYHDLTVVEGEVDQLESLLMSCMVGY